MLPAARTAPLPEQPQASAPHRSPQRSARNSGVALHDWLPTCVYLNSIAAATNIVLDDDPLLCGLLLLLLLNGLCSIAKDMCSLCLCVCALHRPRDPMSHQKLSHLQ